MDTWQIYENLKNLYNEYCFKESIWEEKNYNEFVKRLCDILKI